jgi:hypothetical protein
MDWATLMNRPAAYVHPARLAACFDGRITVRLCGRLLSASRLEDKLSLIINKFYALPTPVAQDAVSPSDQKIALVPMGRISDLIRRAGAIYWANAIANALRAEEVRWLRDRLGVVPYTLALANRHLSRASGTLELTDEAEAQIEEDGVRCLAAWCRMQPAAVRGRILLKSPARPALDDGVLSPFDEIGPAIIRCAA